jgi:adenylate kinase family enzyme
MRTVVIGNSGSGKSWLARRLGERTSTQTIHLDEIFWLPGGFNEKRSPLEVQNLVDSKKVETDWIVEGVFGDLAGQFLSLAQNLIWLDFPWNVCKQRLEARGSESKAHMGRVQSELGSGELIQWAEGYYFRSGSCSHPAHHSLFESFTGKRILLSTEVQVQEFLNVATSSFQRTLFDSH